MMIITIELYIFISYLIKNNNLDFLQLIPNNEAILTPS